MYEQVTVTDDSRGRTTFGQKRPIAPHGCEGNTERTGDLCKSFSCRKQLSGF